MTKRIFRAIYLAALGVLVSSVLLFLVALYSYFEGVQKNQLRMQTELAAQAMAHEGGAFLDGLEAEEYRITWISAEGNVLYDNRADYVEMENHMERQEVRQAMETGLGESERYSATRMERTLYCARKLPDGTVIRISVSINTLLTLLLGMMPPICLILALAFALSLFLASRLSKRIVKPLNEMDLEKPLAAENYEELSPLLHRIDSQQRQIRAQKEELGRKQREFEAVTQNMTEGIVLLNTQDCILEINAAAKRLFKTDTSSIGEPILAVCREPLLEELLRQAAVGQPGELQMEQAGACYQLMLNPVWEGKERIGSVLLILNITEKEKAEAMRREFTANVSHELKTPLHTIAGSAELLADGMVKEEDKPEFYLRIQREAKRMIRLVEDIIHLSHLDEGAGDMKWEEVSLREVARETLQSLEEAARKAKVTLNLRGADLRVWGNRQLVQSIFYNLCDNAIKYNREGGTVDVCVERKDGKSEVLVSDTGIGISEEHRQRIFERFYRVDKSRSKELGGTGLGLSIVKHAVMVLGGTIDLESELGKGTVIRVTFPEKTSEQVLSAV